MSKKKFTNGLESVFTDSYEEDEVSTAVLEEAPEARSSRGTVRKGGKDFSGDMDDVILKSFVTNGEPQPFNDNNEHNNYAHMKKAQRRPLNGLEALLSRTLEYGELDADTKKRIVLILENNKVERLKEIAKEEQLFLKDIIVKSVSYYIDQHDKKRSRL